MNAKPLVEEALSMVDSSIAQLVLNHSGWNAASELISARLAYRRDGRFTLPQLLWKFRWKQCTITVRDLEPNRQNQDGLPKL